MALHLLKMCVGIADLDQLKAAQRARWGAEGPFRHRTRNFPKRADEILYGGSLYWIIKGQIRVRQPILGFDAETDEEGRRYCFIRLKPDYIETLAEPRRPMQGWRYLAEDDAPPDRRTGLAEDGDEMPVEMLRELRALGLL
ncbi:MAG TPA: DUF1489 domain-containing protein [Stellaceae bacterium]|nr:DUF1489 domain-containing protein [Stellaceae bacterium]